MLSIWNLEARELNTRIWNTNAQPSFDWRDLDTPMSHHIPVHTAHIQNPVPLRMTLDLAMSLFRDRGCCDPRDRLFSAIRLIDWPRGVSPIVPNYFMTRLDLALAIIGCYAEGTSSTGILCIPFAINTFAAMQLEPGHREVYDFLEHRRRKERVQWQSKSDRVIKHEGFEMLPALKDVYVYHATVIQTGNDGRLQLPWQVWDAGDWTPLHNAYHDKDKFKSLNVADAQEIWLGRSSAGHASPHVLPGDLLVALHQKNPLGPLLWLVLRQCDDGERLRIVGSAVLDRALLIRNCDLVDCCGDHCRWGQDHHMAGVELVRFYFSAADLISLAAKFTHRRTDSKGELINDDVPWDPTDINLLCTEESFSSYAVEEL